MVTTIRLLKLDKTDEKLRGDLIRDAIMLVELEKIDIPAYTTEEVADFALSWPGLTGKVAKQVKEVLLESLGDGTVLEWVGKNYSIDRLEVFYRFSGYCDWLGPKEIAEHFGELLKLFMAIQGKAPKWCYIPFHDLLSRAYVHLSTRQRGETIRRWLRSHWVAVQRYFDGDGKPMNFPYSGGVDERDVYTQYKKVGLEKAREYLRKHPEVVEKFKGRLYNEV